MPATTHIGGSGGGRTVRARVVLTFAEPAVTVSVPVPEPGAQGCVGAGGPGVVPPSPAPAVTVSVTVHEPGAKGCVAVEPVACAVPSPKSQRYASTWLGGSRAVKRTFLFGVTFEGTKGELSPRYCGENPPEGPVTLIVYDFEHCEEPSALGIVSVTV